jgi:hypothetical protein
MPRHLHAVAAGLAEDLAAPQDHVVTDQLRDAVDQRRIAREVEERRAAAHALGVAPLDMHADQPLRAHAGVLADQPLERVAQVAELGVGQPIRRHDPAVAAIAVDLVGGEQRHRGVSWSSAGAPAAGPRSL